MPRKQKQPIPTMERMPPAITKLDNVPGPEDNFSVLYKHYSRVQVVVACHNYDDVILTCRWCCDMEAPLVYSKPEHARGNKMFCSGRCASAYGAFRAEQLRKPKDSKDPSTDDARPTKGKSTAKVGKGGNGGSDLGNPITEAQEVSAAKDEEPAEDEVTPAPRKPKGQSERKPRKPNAKKPERVDGLCSKGLHKMDEANTYNYNGGTWCRTCRKASRDASAAKRKAG